MKKSVGCIRYLERDGSEKELLLVCSTESSSWKLAAIVTAFEDRGLIVLDVSRATYAINRVAQQGHFGALTVQIAA